MKGEFGMRKLTIEEKKTPEMFARAKHNLEYWIASEKEAIEKTPTGFAAGWEWHKPFHEDQLAALEAKYARLLKDGYV